MIRLLIAIRDILYLIKDVVIRIGKIKDKKKVDEAIEKSDEEVSQRSIENELSNDSGNPTKYSYRGLFKRSKKDKAD